MKLDEMRKIAEARTPGKWVSVVKFRPCETHYINAESEENDLCYFEEFLIDRSMNSKNNAAFTVLAANTYDLLLDIAEAAEKFRKGTFYKDYSDYYGFNELMNSIKNLEELENVET